MTKNSEGWQFTPNLNCDQWRSSFEPETNKKPKFSRHVSHQLSGALLHLTSKQPSLFTQLYDQQQSMIK